jgi:hypothetical protein
LKIAEEKGAEVSWGKAAAADLTAELSCEGMVRLVWGRYDVAAALKSGELKLSDASQAEALQALLPGR